VVGSHPDSDELRVLAGQKNNLSLPPRGLAYRIESAENGTARITYRGFSEATAAQLLRVPEGEEEKSALAEAKEFLTSELARTPRVGQGDQEERPGGRDLGAELEEGQAGAGGEAREGKRWIVDVEPAG